MHQDHNIPWKTLATHLTITEGVHPAFSTRPRPLNFYPRDRQDQGKTFTYFSNAIIKSIQDFATTERQKYPSKLPIKKTEDLFSDELIQRCHAKYDGYYNHRKYYPNEDNQKLEHWCSRVKPANPSGWLCSLGPHYDARDIDLADTIKVLVIENEMVPVLQLASHPSVPLMTLYRLCSPNRGWNQLAKYTIQVYIYLNILAEFPEYCENRKYQSLYSYWPLMDKATHYDSPVAIFTHSYLDPLDEEDDGKGMRY
ncbi:hypothetical protein BGX28_008764 [Mortierella sp. GBA30]|nr:hypothetical protein BGX28_008764 [Mortierella sp. GBA30]